jgi:hypothetical protein
MASDWASMSFCWASILPVASASLTRSGERVLSRAANSALSPSSFRLELRQLLLVLGDGLLRGFDARGRGDLGRFVLGLGGDEVSDVLLELGELLLLGQHADVELRGLEGDDALTVSRGLGDDVADVGLGRGQVGLGLGQRGFGGAGTNQRLDGPWRLLC